MDRLRRKLERTAGFVITVSSSDRNAVEDISRTTVETTTTMVLKLLSSNELKIVQDLAYATWPDTFKDILTSEQIHYMLEWMYNLETLRKQVEDGHLFYVYLDKGVPLGFMGIEPNHPTQDSLKIHKIYVLPQTQGSGVGKKLLQKAMEVANDTGISKLVLNVNRFNKAVSFYQYIGFVIEYEENIDIGNGFLMEDFVMCLNLPA